MKYSSRFFLYAPLAIFLGIAVWVSVHWWLAAGAMEKKLTALNGREVVPGITINYATKTISGFPFRVDVVFTGFKIAGKGAHGPFAWSSERFALHALTYGRATDVFEAAGNQTLRWTRPSGATHSLSFLPGTLQASAVRDQNGLSRFDLDIVDAGGKDGEGDSFTAARLQFHLRRNPNGTSLDLMASADDLMTEHGFLDMGRELHAVRVYNTLSPISIFMPLLAGKALWPDTKNAYLDVTGGRQVRAEVIKYPGDKPEKWDPHSLTLGPLMLMVPLY